MTEAGGAGFLSILRRILPPLIALILILALVYLADWQSMAAALSEADLPLLLFATLLTALTILLAVCRWQILLGVFGIKAPFWRIARILLEATTVNLFIPGGVAGDVARAFSIRNDVKTAGDAVSSVVTDRVVGLLGFLALGLLALTVRWTQLNDAALAIPTVIVSILLIVGVCLLYSRRLSDWLMKALNFVPALRGFAAGILEGLLSHRLNGKRIGAAFVLVLAGHFSQILATWVIALALDIHVGFFWFLLYVPVIALLAAVPISHFGIGIRETGFVVLLSLEGVATEPALLLSLVFSVIAIFLPASIGTATIGWRFLQSGELRFRTDGSKGSK